MADAFLVRGNFWGNEYRFYRDGEEFAYASKNIWNLTDEYGIAIHTDQEETLVLAVVVIINIIRGLRQSKG